MLATTSCKQVCFGQTPRACEPTPRLGLPGKEPAGDARVEPARHARAEPSAHAECTRPFAQEEVEKLSAARPKTLHEASLIQGITPKALLFLYKEVSRRGNADAAEAVGVASPAGAVEADLVSKRESANHHFQDSP